MKASVLPDPVQLSTARFERLIILGTTAFWTGKGREKSSLRSCSASLSNSGWPKSTRDRISPFTIAPGGLSHPVVADLSML